METAANSNIDSLLDATLDQLADMPEFKTFPVGVHLVTIKWEKKDINKHPAIELKMTALETVELADATKDVPLEKGTETSVIFMLDNEFGQGSLKELAKPIAKALGNENMSIRQVMEGSEGMSLKVVTTIRQNKDKTASYTAIKSAEVA